MTYAATIHATAALALTDAENAYLEALTTAVTRACHSYFDQHIVRMDDGRCWVLDEGSYEGWMRDLEDRIIHTVPAGLSDDG